MPQAGQQVSVAEGQMEPVRRGWKKGGRDVVPHPTGAIGLRAEGPAQFAVRLYPVEPGKAIPETARIELIENAAGNQAMAVRVTVLGRKPLIIADQLGEDALSAAGKRTKARRAVWD